MPTTIPPRPSAAIRGAANRGQADDHRIARGQIELVDLLTRRLSQVCDRLAGILFGAPR